MALVAARLVSLLESRHALSHSARVAVQISENVSLNFHGTEQTLIPGTRVAYKQKKIQCEYEILITHVILSRER